MQVAQCARSADGRRAERGPRWHRRPGGSNNPTPCTPDTALAFVAWFDFPTNPAMPRVVPIAPPQDWGTRGNAGPSAGYWAAAAAQGVPNPLLGM